MTAGIVSSRGRDLGSGPYDDFIQIDAPLNTGNSGGPLFNSDGQVVGVNTAIFSPNGGSIGIGFAIPSNSAEKIVAELREKGSVQRGWLGVAIQPVTPDVADSLGLKQAGRRAGRHRHGRQPGGEGGRTSGRRRPRLQRNPGDDAAGPEPRGRRLRSIRRRPWPSGATTARSTSTSASARCPVRSPRPKSRRRSPPSRTEGGVELSALGLTLAPIDNGTRARYGLPKGTSGAVVASVDERADAAEKGLKPGDVITRVNQEAVAGPSDVASAVEKAKAAQRKSILLLVEREGDQRFVAVDLAST